MRDRSAVWNCGPAFTGRPRESVGDLHINKRVQFLHEIVQGNSHHHLHFMIQRLTNGPQADEGSIHRAPNVS